MHFHLKRQISYLPFFLSIDKVKKEYELIQQPFLLDDGEIVRQQALKKFLAWYR